MLGPRAASILMTIWLAACATTAPSARPSSHRLDPEAALRAAETRLPLTRCQPEGVNEPVLCGKLSVPENWDDPGDRQIALSVVVIPALARAPDPHPWLDIEGGPSDAATKLAGDYLGDLSIYRRHRDVILVDQRGTGGSGPLRCDPLDAPELPTAPKFPLGAVRACVEQWGARVDLRRYGTGEAVRDLDAVRAWLGYERVHLFGYSYGTLVAQVFLRRFPERVVTTTLWGPVPPDFQRPRWFARDTEQALEGLFSACAEAAPESDGRTCGDQFPNPSVTARAVLERLARAPVRVRWRRPGRLPVTVPLTRATFGEGLGSLAYDTERARLIPWIIARSAAGDFEPFVDAVNRRGRLVLREQTTLMYLAVTCAEETRRFDAVEPGDEATLFGAERARSQRAACAELAPERRPGLDFAPVATRAPVLVFSGSLDPVTPPRWGERVIERMPRARLLVIEGMGHSVKGMSDPGCPDRLANALADGVPIETLDASCVDGMRPPAFFLGPSAETGPRGPRSTS